MPITTDALLVGLKAGAQDYDVKDLGWMPNAIPNGLPGNSRKTTLFIAGFGDTIDDTNKYAKSNDIKGSVGECVAPSGEYFKNPEVKSGKAKTWLTGSVVLDVVANGVIKKIVFALGDTATKFVGNLNGNYVGWGEPIGGNYYNEGITTGIPQKTTESTTPVNKLGDVFMVIDVNISVTQGGFLTIKGGGENLTYITLESTS